jgi:HPt (histidine-containing phosphotransfer) domain-containing protein
MQNHYRIHVVIDAELEDLFPVSLQTRQQDIRTMRDAVACGDYEKIRLLGHSMKGSAGVYGFQRITGIGARIEHAAKEKKRRGDSGMAAGTVRIS